MFLIIFIRKFNKVTKCIPPKCDPVAVYSLHLVWKDPNSDGLVNWAVRTHVSPGLIDSTGMVDPSVGYVCFK